MMYARLGISEHEILVGSGTSVELNLVQRSPRVFP